ncbi:T-cell surface antigen CD2-like [Gasterosteus aculeatus]
MACFAATVGVIILSGLINLTAADKDTCDLHAAVGQNLTLPFVHEVMAKSEVLRWTHNNTIILLRQRGKVSVGRTEDISATGSLLLRNLGFSSAGIYQVHVLNVNGTLAKAWTGRLCVMDKVPKPQVTYTCDLKSGAINLKCHIAKTQPSLFSWTLNGKTLSSETKQTLSLSLAQLEGERSFACSAANRVSREKSDTVRPTCESPPPPTICLASKIAAALLAGGAGVIVVLLIFVIVLCRSHVRIKSQMQRGDEGEARMISLNKRESDSIGREYETLIPTEDSAPRGPDSPPGACYETEAQTENRPEQSTAVGGQLTPVPKPRTKGPRTPNI